MDRKLDVGETLGQAFSIYGAQAAVLLPVAFGLFLLVAVVNGLLAGTIALVPVGIAIGVVATTLYQGMVVELASDVQDGRRDSSVGDLVKAVAPVVLTLIGAGLLAGIGIGIGFLLLIVPGLFLATIWSVIAPSIVVERHGVLSAFGRSRELVRGHGWRVFGVIVSIAVIILVVRVVFGAIAVGIDDAAGVRIAFDIVASTITAPIAALAAAVMYFRLRALYEGASTDIAASPADAPSGQPSAGPSPTA
ncbi:MAG: hypothetical protein WEB79_01270 [Thermoleophilaceae bacterium]